MEKLGLNEIRKMFLEFFESKGHLVHESFSLVPEKDKSLILINSWHGSAETVFRGTRNSAEQENDDLPEVYQDG